MFPSFIGPRSKIKKVFLQISRDSSSLVSNSKMEELFLITTSRRSQPSISSLDLEAEVWVKWKLSQILLPLPESSSVRRWFAENVMLDSHQRLRTAERESVVITEISDQRRRLEADLFRSFYLEVTLFAQGLIKRSYKTLLLRGFGRQIATYLFVIELKSSRGSICSVLTLFP